MATHPNKYNQDQYDKGLLTMAHVSRLTTFWQREHGIDPIDGECGEDTRASLETVKVPYNSTILQIAWSHAQGDIGKGGDGIKNNEGVYLDEIRARTRLPKRGGGAWCAVGISNWIILSDPNLGHTVKNRGAPGLVNNMLNAGAQEVAPEGMNPGDVCVGLYARGNINSRLHHVRMLKLGVVGRWEAIGANERGDKVNHHDWGDAQMERRLVKLVRFA